MTGSNILLDTNIVNELFKGNEAIIANLEDRDMVDIPYVVLGELFLGAYRSTNLKKHKSEISSFLKRCNVIGADAKTSYTYGMIKAELLEKGKPIPENDIWIAAVAKQYGYTLVTRDKHFNEVNGLRVVNWFQNIQIF